MSTSKAGIVRLQVRKLAAKRGIHNANQLAQRTGISYAVCYKIFSADGNQAVHLKTLAKLCDELQVKPGDLFSYSRNGSAKKA